MQIPDPLTLAPVREAIDRLADLGLDRLTMIEALHWLRANVHRAVAPRKGKPTQRLLDFACSLVLLDAEPCTVLPDWFDIGWSRVHTLETGEADYYVKAGASELSLTAWATMRTAHAIHKAAQVSQQKANRTAGAGERARAVFGVENARRALAAYRSKLADLERKYPDPIMQWGYQHRFDTAHAGIARNEALLRDHAARLSALRGSPEVARTSGSPPA